MFSHGTVLVDSNLDDVTAALRPKPGKVESKGVKSIRSRVANIVEFLPAPITADALRERILERIFGTADRARIPQIELTAADWAAVHELVARKYGTWEWNYGENPSSNVQRSRRFPAGEIDARIDVQHGRIAAVRLFGDYMGRHDVRELEARLVGVPYERPAVALALAGVEVREYFGEVGVDDLLDVLAP
jgi:lipoate---protein ligase